jgi:hypothetical protein
MQCPEGMTAMELAVKLDVDKKDIKIYYGQDLAIISESGVKINDQLLDISAVSNVAQIPSCATLALWLPKQSGLKRVWVKKLTKVLVCASFAKMPLRS